MRVRCAGFLFLEARDPKAVHALIDVAMCGKRALIDLRTNEE